METSSAVGRGSEWRTHWTHISLNVYCKIIVTATSELRKVLFLVLSATFLVCVWNISGTAEWICVKFTGNTCLVPCLDEFECQGQRSRSPGTKTGFSADIPGTTEHICDKFTFGPAQIISKVKVNVGGVRAFYVCKNIFVLVVTVVVLKQPTCISWSRVQLRLSLKLIIRHPGGAI